MTGRELDRETAIGLLEGMANRLRKGEPLNVAGIVLAKLSLEMLGKGKPH